MTKLGFIKKYWRTGLVIVAVGVLINYGVRYHLKAVNEAENVVVRQCVQVESTCIGGVIDTRFEKEAGTGKRNVKCYCTHSN